jgi:hypothetical protein
MRYDKFTQKAQEALALAQRLRVIWLIPVHPADDGRIVDMLKANLILVAYTFIPARFNSASCSRTVSALMQIVRW